MTNLDPSSDAVLALMRAIERFTGQPVTNLQRLTTRALPIDREGVLHRVFQWNEVPIAWVRTKVVSDDRAPWHPGGELIELLLPRPTGPRTSSST